MIALPVKTPAAVSAQGPPTWPAETPVPDIGAMHDQGPGPTSIPGLLALGYIGSNTGLAQVPFGTGGSPQ